MSALFVGENKFFLPETQSTNSYAISLLKNVNLPEGTLIYTHHQTAGRGRRNHGWESEPGMNVTASYTLKPTFLEVKKIFSLYVISSLAIYDVLSHFLPDGQFDIKIKWPNDILINGKKIAGVLNENILKEHHIQHSIIGIGININQTKFPKTIKATSLKILTNKDINLESVFEVLNSRLEKHYMKLKAERKANKNHYDSEIIKRYYKNMYKLNETCLLETAKGLGSYIIRGINENGLLLVEDDKKIVHEFDLHQVVWKI